VEWIDVNQSINHFIVIRHDRTHTYTRNRVNVDVLCCARNHWVIRCQSRSSYSQTLLRWIVLLSSTLHSRHCTVIKQPTVHCLDLSMWYTVMCFAFTVWPVM